MNDIANRLHQFSMPAKYRRCGWYVFLGTLLTLSIAAYFKATGLVPDAGAGWGPFAMGAVVFSSLASAQLFAIYRWRLQLCENGVSRRRFWAWHYWPWEQFATGVVKRRGGGFVCSTGPWWQREISFDWLEKTDRMYALDFCKLHYRIVDEEPAVKCSTHEMEVRYAVGRSLAFSRYGLSWGSTRGERNVNWSEVEEVRLIYYDHWSDEPCRLELALFKKTLQIAGISKVLDSGTVILKHGRPSVIPKVVVHYLQKNVPEQKLVRHALHGWPNTREECELRRQKLIQKLRRITWACRVVPTGFLSLTSINFAPKLFALWRNPGVLDWGWLVVITMIGVANIVAMPLTLWAVLYESRRQHIAEVNLLDGWKDGSCARDKSADAFGQGSPSLDRPWTEQQDFAHVDRA